LAGKILSVAKDGVLLKGTGFGVGSSDLVFVKNVEGAHADDEEISLVAVPAGTHHYRSAGNAERTIPAFDAARPTNHERRLFHSSFFLLSKRIILNNLAGLE
jgi:hypothetical protein